MADVKISQLTAKGSKVASTDRIMISEDAGGGTFTSKYVTGSEVNKLSLDTTPQLGGNLDVNGNKITSASNGNVIIEPNGTGALVIGGNSTAATTVRFMEDSDNGTNFIGLKAPDNLAASSVFVLPNADGTNGQALVTDGSRNLSWATAGSVTNVSALTLGTTGTDLSSTVVNSTTTPVITLNVPTASATNRGALSSADWTTFNNKVSTGAITGSGLTMATSRLLGRTTASNGAVEEISIGTGLTLSGGTLSSTGGGLTIGTTAITSGTVGRILFEGTGNVVQEDSALFWDNTNKRLGVGATPNTSTRLDVRAQGTLSTDIAFRVRNSADSVTLTEIQGTGNLITRHNSSGSSLGLFHRTDTTGFSLTTGTSGYGTGNGIEVVASTWIIQSGARQFAFTTNGGTDGDLWTFQNNGTAAGKRMSLSKSGNETFCWSGENFSIGGNIWGNPPTETNSFGIKNGTAPSTNATDAFKLYSADITAGNAAPHFRTENGNIIKLYRETTAVAAATLVGNAGTNITDTDTFDGYTLKQIVKALRNQGLLA